jgi:hypothetical protein
MTATDESHQEHVEEIIRGNRRIKQKDITLKLEASEERVGPHHQPSWIPKSLYQVDATKIAW